ncbi:two-component system sensor histidine kinase NtrB [Singulisphaera acidiphila]|uniref:histidine kinase n=1 Tax=Singulisphaera acidiphila (strain ATCC BAA-1392 / DSM 18658 / VKM B-2454 / MOB10) TaxID=886293 RepID=L0DG45_SINAD|nr:ATP-binding protein [Singulisphaera acidiphila]AGA27820.1 PAS domain S-box [Singulisphaera acidiphila DSM 18658]
MGRGGGEGLAILRIKASEAHTRISLTPAIVLLMLVVALALSIAAVQQVFVEYRLLGTWVGGLRPVSVAEIKSLRQEIGTRIIVRAIASAVLLFCTLTTLWLQQHQLDVRRALHQVKLLARDILASMDQGVITIDLQNNVTSINPASTRILGLEFECVGRPLASLSSGGPPLIALAAQVAARHTAVWDHDFDVEREGRLRRIRAHVHVLKDSAGDALGCVILLRDVSDRILMEDRVRRMERFVSLGTLASGLHHEIKNPLTALSIHVQLLEKRLRDPTLKKPVDELIDVLKSEVHRLNGVLESFHDFASLQHLIVQPTDAHELLEETLRLIGPQAAQQNVDVTLDRKPAKLPRTMMDADKFKQAILNLVINSLEAMPEGGSLNLHASAPDGELLIRIADTGPGIPPEIQQELFKPYVSTKTRGTGMGLALTEKVVSQHGGRIIFQTGPQGTTFSLFIPREPIAGANGAS